MSTSTAPAHTVPPQPLSTAPTLHQLAWQRLETNLFIHFCPNTFTNREWGEGTESPTIFHPTKLDTRQWASVAKQAGIQLAILTAKHHDGFCLWPSKFTEHSVKNCLWKNGRGDLVREFVEAFRAAGIKVGLYLSPWDRHEPSYGDSPRYNQHYINQLTELCTQYGPLHEVWFDGACGEGPNGKKQVYDWAGIFATVKKLQPQAVTFGDGGTDLRWCGNEEGYAGDPCWAAIVSGRVRFPGDAGNVQAVGGKAREAYFNHLQHGQEEGDIWEPAEVDVSIRPGWFYHEAENEKVRSVDNLVQLYFQSVGRNSLLLLNVPPTSEGLFHQVDQERIIGMRAELNRIFAHDLAQGKNATATNIRGNDSAFGPAQALNASDNAYWATDDGVTTATLEVNLGQPTKFNVVMIQEAIALGQRVRSYRVEAPADSTGITWRIVTQGSTVGYKRLARFDAVTADRARLVIEQSRACPTISRFGLFHDEKR